MNPLIDRLRAYDPGGIRVRLAAQVAVTMIAAMAAEWLLVQARHDPVPVVPLMLGAVIALCGVFAAPMFDTPRQQALNLALIPIPVLGGMTLGLALAPYQLWGFVAVIVVLTGGAYLRRFGPRGFFGGSFAFIGTFFGLFLHGVITLRSLGWLAVEVVLAVIVTVGLQLTLFRIRNDRTLARLRRSFGARSRAVAAAALALTESPAPRRRERLVRRLRRRTLAFNEAALMADAYLERPGALPAGTSPGIVHQRLFDLELAVTNLARFAVTLAGADLPPALRDLVREGLAAVGELDAARADAAGRAVLEELPEGPQRIVAHRFGGCLRAGAEALYGLRGLPSDEPDVLFAAAAELAGGFLPGSAGVSQTASEEPQTVRRFGRSGIPPNVRVAGQMAVAATVALVLGYAVDHRRWYWAVIAAFVTFMGAHNAGEQLRKGSLRVIGTVAGVLVGALLAHAIGPHVYAALAVIVAALFLGLYLMRSSYAWFVMAVTIAVSQLYVELGEYSDDLLLLRLGETAIGAAVALLTVLAVMPLRTGRVVRVATREYLTALSAVVDSAVRQLLGTGSDARVLGAGSDARVLGTGSDPRVLDTGSDPRVLGTGSDPRVLDTGSDLRAEVRRLDAAYQALTATLAALGVPLLPVPSARILFANSLSASRNYARNLLADATPAALPPEALRLAADTLQASIEALVAALRRDSPGSYVRSASRFAALAAALPLPDTAAPQLALRDLQLIDGSLAVIAEQLGLTVTALDQDESMQAADS
ncbi:FUSC family protein [Dactylosporangium sp. NPDC000244]|uniref:FUSC family protein n=1 Tax=Dactylosporangium sp. NPDC000244 TaxID=3154365 RepID=UPI00331DBA24